MVAHVVHLVLCEVYVFCFEVTAKRNSLRGQRADNSKIHSSRYLRKLLGRLPAPIITSKIFHPFRCYLLTAPLLANIMLPISIAKLACRQGKVAGSSGNFRGKCVTRVPDACGTFAPAGGIRLLKMLLQLLRVSFPRKDQAPYASPGGWPRQKPEGTWARIYPRYPHYS